MRLFVDSSDITVWHKISRLGWVYGATTNPSILKKDGNSCTHATYVNLVAGARDLGFKELQIQATGSSADALFESGTMISHLTGHIDMVAKLPFTGAGMEAAARLIRDGHRVTMTAVYAAHQMIAATAMGAAYVAPYYGRMVEAGKDADTIMATMATIYRHSQKAPRILVASIRSLAQLEALSAQGFDTFTLGPKLAEQLAQSDLSDKVALDFEAARLN